MSGIPIANLCHMLAYAYGGGFREILTRGVGLADASQCKDAHSLYAELLLRELKKQLRNGLCKQDFMFHEVLPSPRGRIDIVKTVTAGEHYRSCFACYFGEMSEDCLPNRIIKTMLHHLLKLEGINSKAEIKRHLALMEGIGLVTLSSIDWMRLSEMRLSASYRRMIGLCHLIVKGLLQEGRDGNYSVILFDHDKKASLFEAFVRGFYQESSEELTRKPDKQEIKWRFNYDKVEQVQMGNISDSARTIPRMFADIILENDTHMLIIDTKFYKRAWQSKSTANSANFYQIYSYVKNAAKGNKRDVRGLLLYAKTEGEEELKVDCTIDGNDFFIRMIDLSVPDFKQVENQLLEFKKLLSYKVSHCTC